MERKQILRDSVKDGVNVVVSDFVEERGEAYFKIVAEKGLEGVIAKRKTSLYEQGLRTGSWQKIKSLKSADCARFGYTKGECSRASTFGALVVGLYDNSGNPVYVASVGTGFDQTLLESLLCQFQEIRTNDQVSPFSVQRHNGKTI